MNETQRKRGSLTQYGRAAGLWIVRESDENDRLLFDAMRHNTYAQSLDIPAVQAISELGMLPFDCDGSFVVLREREDGTPVLDTVVVEEVKRGRTRAILFCYQGSWHLWMMGSAAKEDEKGINEFTEILIDVIGRLRPVSLYANSISRLIRSQKQADILKVGMRDNVDRIVAGSAPLSLVGEQADFGWMSLTLLGTMAAMERNWIAARLLTGRIAKHRRGEWPWGADQVPFGYVYDKQTRTVKPDPSKRERVEQLLRLLADNLPPADLLDGVGDLGMTIRRGKQKGRPVSSSVNPTMTQHAIYSMASVWICGEYLLRLKNTAGPVDSVGGVPVVRFGDHEDDVEVDSAGEVQLLHLLDVPDGGWAPSEVLTAARQAVIAWHTRRNAARRIRMRPLAPQVLASSSAPDLLSVLATVTMHGNGDEIAQQVLGVVRGRRTGSLLAGRGWTQDGFRYELRVAQAGTYDIVRSTLLTAVPVSTDGAAR